MYKKVLLCTDLSAASDKLLDATVQLKSLGLEEVVLAYIISSEHSPMGIERIREDSLPVVNAQKSYLQDMGLKVTVEIQAGIPSRKLHKLSEKYDVSAIVTGSHGKGIFKKAFMGSVSSELLQICERPIILIRLELDDEEANVELTFDKLFDHVLFLTDFSEVADRAFLYLEKAVSETKCAVTLMHVQDSTTIDPHLIYQLDYFNKVDGVRLDKLKNRLMDKGASQVENVLSFGPTVKEILKQINNPENKYSLIIMGSQGKGFFGEALLGSVSHKVSRLSQVPILLIPPKHQNDN
ncbi:nucleotide-binding universal stress UspA family protein [Desulfitispora alkaliphila]|uniref:universal stress protein n=1 Tax=Desulfitispora alkaliphila TaxID=622674 RepID=UPI003D217505